MLGEMIECIFSQVPIYKSSIDQVQRLSYVYQLTVLCIFNRFNMKNNFYLDFNGFIVFWNQTLHLIQSHQRD